MSGGYYFTKIDLAEAPTTISSWHLRRRWNALCTHRAILLQAYLPFGISLALRLSTSMSTGEGGVHDVDELIIVAITL